MASPPSPSSPMSSHHYLQPSPFTPDQFLRCPPSATQTEYQDDFTHLFSKRRHFRFTEHLIQGRVAQGFARHAHRYIDQHPPTPMDDPEPEFCSIPATMDVDPTTPPKRPLPESHDHPRDPERRWPSRTYLKSRRSQSLRRACSSSSPSRKFKRCDASPYHLRSRSPLARWTPPPVAPFPLYSLESSDFPSTPVRSTSSRVFDAPPRGWINPTSFPWTVASPSSSPYTSHSSPTSQI